MPCRGASTCRFFTPAAGARRRPPRPGRADAGLGPIVILNAILGTPENLDYWREELLAYAASTAPPPQTKKERPHVTPTDLADRVDPIAALRARALLRNSFGDLEAAKAVLERLAELAGALDETAPDDTTSKPRTQATKRSEAARRSAMAPARKK